MGLDAYGDRPKMGQYKFSKGPLLYFTQFLIVIFWWTSFIEHWKALFWMLSKSPRFSNDADARAIAIDTYQIAKWSIVLYTLASASQKICCAILVGYLLISNLFSYFYYHIWKDRSSESNRLNDQRRLLGFIAAFFFMIFGYSALYGGYFSSNIDLGICSNWFDALLISSANTFTLTYDGYGPTNRLGFALLISQVTQAFFFLVIIVSNSIPKP